RSQLKEGDILFSIAGTLGRTAKVTKRDLPANTNQALALVRLINLGQLDFVTSVLNSKRTKKRIHELLSVGAQPNLSLSQVNDFAIPSPSPQEQKKISNFLQIIDEWIGNLKAQKQKWEEYKKGMTQKIFPSGAGQVSEIRFKDEDGNEFPEWEEKRLGEVAEVDPSISALPQEFCYIDLESVDDGQLNGYMRLSKDNAPSRAQRVLEKGDILFQTVRPYQQNNLFFNLDGDFVASTGYAQIRAKQNSRFLYHYLHAQTFLRDVLARCTGSNYPAINSSDLKRITIRFPSEDEQQKIAGFLTAVDEMIHSHQQRIAQAEEWKKGLMQRMFV
ncbi:MAG: restriction endonuclease subunit S, partial [Candidatus Uhrbacteria bacterium]|nr:restriction endonuclease subunit S [Candidatus Uhrbacteria bacterium]